MNIFLRDEAMHLRIKKGMLVRLMQDRMIVTVLVISDVYMIKEMFHMVDVIFRGKKRSIRANWIREICDDIK